MVHQVNFGAGQRDIAERVFRITHIHRGTVWKPQIQIPRCMCGSRSWRLSHIPLHKDEKKEAFGNSDVAVLMVTHIFSCVGDVRTP